MDKSPKVSVLMSAYNDATYLREAIEGILTQTFVDFEFLIVNDGSTDGTRSTVLDYSDRRIRLIDNEVNLGLPASLNIGLRAARGEYIARQDANDVSLPGRLEVQVSHLDGNSDVALVGCWWQWIDIDGRVYNEIRSATDSDTIHEELIEDRAKIPHTLFMARKRALDDIGGYDERFFYTQDYELYLRMSRRYKFAVVPSVLFQIRKCPRASNLQALCQSEFGSLARRIYESAGRSVEVPTVSELAKQFGERVQVYENREVPYWLGLARQSRYRGKNRLSALYYVRAAWRAFRGERFPAGLFSSLRLATGFVLKAGKPIFSRKPL